ncbi:hypothetical protein L6267_03170 [Candidatus Parcubacteria bacterium]|nr:hypothetical protein [Candidatus Parcubacteria bacterium]
MNTKTAVSVTLNQANIQFVEKIAKKEKKSRSEIIDYALEVYRKFRLRNDVIAGFKDQTEEDVLDAMSDFRDYFNLVGR